MNNIENRIVEMKFDNAQFEQAVAQTMSTLDKFKDKLNFDDAGKGMDKIGEATGGLSGILGGLGGVIDSVADHFSNLSGVGSRVFDALTSGVTGFITNGLNKLASDVVQGGQSRAMNLEQAKFQLQGILGNAQEVNRVIYDDILPELQGTPFSLDQAAVVMGQLAASGKKSSEEVRQGTRAIAGAAAMTNSSFADMGRIFTKVAGNGRVMGDTLQEMSSRGLNAAADIGKVFDMTEAEVREAVTAGQISYDMFAQAMDQLYGEQATKSTTMYTGALEDLRAALARIGAEPQAVKLEFLRDAFNALVPAVDAVNAVLKPLWNSAHGLETVMKDGKEVQQYAKAFQGPVAQSVQKAGWAFQSLFVQLDDNHDIMRYTEKNIESFGYKVREAADGTKEYYEELEDGTEVVHAFGEAIMNRDMLRIMTSSAQSAVNVGTALVKIIKAIGQGILDAFPSLGLKNVANFVDGVESFTRALILSDSTLQSIKFAIQAVFTPVGLLVRVLITGAKILIEFVRIVYHSVGPILQMLVSMVGAAAGMFSGLGKAVDNAAADVTGIAQKLYDAVKSFAVFLHLDKLASVLRNTLLKLSNTFAKVGLTSYNFLANLSKNTKELASTIYKKLKLDEVGQKILMIRDRLKAAVAATGGFLGFEKVVAAFKRLKEAISNLFTTSLSLDNLGNSLKNFGSRLIAAIPTDKILNALDRFADYLTRVVYAVAGFVGPKIEAVVNFFERVGKSIKRFFSALKISVSLVGVLDTLKLAMWGFSKIIPRLFGFKSFGDILDSIKSKVKAFVEVFQGFIDAIAGGAKSGFSSVGKNVTGGFNSLVNDKLVGKVQNFSGVIKTFGSIVSSIGGGIGKKLKEFYAAIEEGDKKKIIASLSLLLMAFGYLRTINRVGKTVKSIGSIFTGIKKFTDGLGSMVGSISGVGKAIKRITYLIGVTTSLLIFAAALSLLGRMDMDTLVQGGIAAIGSLIALTVSLAILNKIADKQKGGPDKLIKLGASMAAVGAAVYLIAKSMEKLSAVYNANDGVGYIAIVGTLAGMLIAFGLLAKTFSKMDKMEVNLKSAGLAMLAIASAVKIMVGAMAAIGSMDIGTLAKGAITIVAILGLMTLLSYEAGKNENTAKAATALATLTASLLAMAAAIWIFGKMDLGTWGAGIIKMAISLAALLGVLTIFNKAAGPKEAGGIVLVAVAMGILAGALVILSAIPFTALVQGLGAIAIAMVVIAGTMALFSAVGIGMLAVAGAFALLGIAMLSVGAGALALTLALSMLIPLFMALSAVPTDLIQGGLDVLGVIAEGLKLIFYDLAKGVLAFGAALLVAAVAAVILGAGIVIIGAGLVVVGLGLLAFAGGLAVLALTVQAFFGGDFLGSIGSALSNFGTIVIGGLTGIVDRVKGIFSKDKGKEVTQNFVDGGSEAIDDSSNSWSESFEGVLDEFTTSAGDKKGEFTESFKSLMDGGSEGIVAGTPNLENQFGISLDGLTGVAGDKKGDISSVLSKIPGDAGSAIAKNKDSYKAGLSKMFSSGSEATKKNTKDIQKEAKATSKAYTDELGNSSHGTNAGKATKSMVDSSKKSFKNISRDFKGYGQDAGDGFAIGIRAKAADAAREAAAMVTRAKNAAKRAQNSNSPSKDFAEFGRWADEGYILGLKSLSGKVATAASDMVGGGIEAVTDAMSVIASVSEMNFDVDPIITPVVDLTNVDKSLGQINSMYGSTFGLNSPFGAMSAGYAAQSFVEARQMSERMDSINRLANKLDSMTESMNSRALNNYITVDGASDPEAFADDLIRSFRLNARTV